MNKVTNQDGDTVIAVGGEKSHIRNADVYNKTVLRLICRIRTVWSRGGIDRHCEYADLEEILRDDDIPKDKWQALVNTAYYYFDKERGIKL